MKQSIHFRINVSHIDAVIEKNGEAHHRLHPRHTKHVIAASKKAESFRRYACPLPAPVVKQKGKPRGKLFKNVMHAACVPSRTCVRSSRHMPGMANLINLTQKMGYAYPGYNSAVVFCVFQSHHAWLKYDISQIRHWRRGWIWGAGGTRQFGGPLEAMTAHQTPKSKILTWLLK